MSYSVAYRGITRFFDREEDAEKFCKLCMISLSSIILANV